MGSAPMVRAKRNRRTRVRISVAAAAVGALAAGIVWVQVGLIGASLAGQCVEDVGDRNNTNELARRG